MVELMDDEWASEHGGEVLYEEPDRVMRSRINNSRVASGIIFGAGVMFLAMALFGWPGTTRYNTCLAFSIAGMVFFAAMAVIILRRAKSISRFRIHEKGMTRGTRDSFLRFEDVYYVEEIRTRRQGYRVTALTPVDMEPVIVISRNSNVKDANIITKDYVRVRDIIKKQVFLHGPGVLDWDDNAVVFMSNLRGARGPVMLTAEKVAARRHAGRIDMDFLLSNWQEIAQRARWRGIHFVKAAKEAIKEGKA